MASPHVTTKGISDLNRDGREKLMDKLLYVMMIEKSKLYNKVNKAVITRHIEHIQNLDNAGKLVLCGSLKGYSGVAGMVIIKTESYEEAKNICKAEPLVVEGFATYKLSTLQVANKENNYLL